MSASDEPFWKRCSTCKTPIPFAATHWVCSVSTCNRGHTALAFCSVACWDSHVPILRHRDAWAEERTSPSRGEWERDRDAAIGRAAEQVAPPRRLSSAPSTAFEASTATPATPSSLPGSAAPSAGRSPAPTAPPARRGGGGDPPQSTAARSDPPTEREILVVASKLKAYIRARSGMNTSDGVLPVLSDRLRELCDDAIRRAAEAGRKTVLDRDF